MLAYSVVGIGALLFPVPRRVDEGVAALYTGTTIIEGALQAAASISALAVLGISLDAGAQDAGALVAVPVALRTWTYAVVMRRTAVCSLCHLRFAGDADVIDHIDRNHRSARGARFGIPGDVSCGTGAQ